MTICIAALAEKGKKVIVCADQMITANIPISYEFETEDVQKIYKLNDNCVVLTAGNAIFAYEIVEKTKKALNSMDQSLSAEEIAEALRLEYVRFRHKIISRNVLEPRNLDINQYLQIQQRLIPGVAQDIENALVNHDIGTEFIVAGCDGDGQCHIFTVTNPGQVLCHDGIGYVCVGSGSPHATYYLIGEKYSKKQETTDAKAQVEAAKKKSEVAPGVGDNTTILVIPDELGKVENGGSDATTTK